MLSILIMFELLLISIILFKINQNYNQQFSVKNIIKASNIMKYRFINDTNY